MKWILLLLFFPFSVSAQMWPNPGPGRAPAEVGGGGGGGPGTDFTADSSCIAAWDFTSPNPSDLCDAGAANNLTLSGAGSTHATVGGLGSWRSGSAGAYYQAADHADYDAVEGDVDMTFGCLLQHPTGSTWADFGGIFTREDWYAMNAFNRASTEVVVFMDAPGTEQPVPNSFSGSHALDTWHLYFGRRSLTADEMQAGWIDGTDGTAVALASFPTANTSLPAVATPFEVGRGFETDFGGIAAPEDVIVSQCFVFSRLLTDSELCELAAYGITGGDFDRSGTITCVP